ncbi:MAG: AAA family ATPase, partial [Chlamydiota bacterium]
NLKNVAIATQNRDLMRDFFGTLKSLDQYLKFTFVTGVSKFSQVSLFSGPNNLTDITMNPKYAAMMGYTEDELVQGFSQHIKAVAKDRSEQEEKILTEIRDWYNGYRFSEKELSVYNPYSTLRFLGEKKAESYWYSTGTPSFLVDEVKKHPRAVIPLKGARALKSTLSDISKIDRISLPALMFQTGYLTICDYSKEDKVYSLDFPNEEVRQAFFDSLLEEFTEINPVEVIDEAKEVRQLLESYDLKGFVAKINSHFAKIAYQVFAKAHEGFYQAVFFTFLEKSGIATITEMATNIGRIDLVSETENKVFIFELKVDKEPENALIQAEAKKYRERFSESGKQILVMGINFNSTSRNIADWKGEVFFPDGTLTQQLSP